MTNKQKIEKLIKIKRDLEVYYDQIEEIFGGDSYTGVGNLTWQMFDLLVDSYSREMGDEDKWIAWFIFDDNCGENGLSYAPKGKKKKKVDNVDDLVKLIEKK